MNRRRLLAGLTGLLGAAVTAAPALASPLPTLEPTVARLHHEKQTLLDTIVGMANDQDKMWKRVFDEQTELRRVATFLGVDTGKESYTTKIGEETLLAVDALKADLQRTTAHRDVLGKQIDDLKQGIAARDHAIESLRRVAKTNYEAGMDAVRHIATGSPITNPRTLAEIEIRQTKGWVQSILQPGEPIVGPSMYLATEPEVGHRETIFVVPRRAGTNIAVTGDQAVDHYSF